MGLGRHPFGALLVAPDGETVLAEQGNVDTVNHAESTLARAAALNFSTDYLWGCTLVTTVEPCAMCSGTQYWANIGTLVYGMTESRLLQLTGNHHENPTFDLPCREVFARGQKAITVIGPVPKWKTRSRRCTATSGSAERPPVRRCAWAARTWRAQPTINRRSRCRGAPRLRRGAPAAPSGACGSACRGGRSPSNTPRHGAACRSPRPGRSPRGCPCPRG